MLLFILKFGTKSRNFLQSSAQVLQNSEVGISWNVDLSVLIFVVIS